ncbi:MAG TPA: shikimate dehydrogenase [Bacteroidota bacterium]|nr:shikimate dehydrogenase [Bacteroidota bacterium]
MNHFAIIGHPIGHTLSPLMYQTAFAQSGIEAQYKAIDVAPEYLASVVQRFRLENYVGFNVTVPHKQGIIQFLDQLSDEAKAIGAVNTVHHKNGKLYGYNTDVLGIFQSLEPYHQRIAQQSCLVLGAGGAARSVMFVLTQQLKPKKIYLTSRTIEKCESLVGTFRSIDVELEILPADSKKFFDAIEESSLMVNTTPLGMFPHADVSPLPANAPLNSRLIVFDLIYRPLQTLLLQQASAAGATAVGGLEMLIQQGAAAFKIWTGQELPLALVRSTLFKELSV